ncbi:MAG: dipeptide ABC transporter ATP-binding protein [Woeseiaceae bacterium]
MGLLSVKNLTVQYPDTQQQAVSSLSFSIDRSESVGLVGESGSGKTQTALAIMGLLPANALYSGSICIDDQELLGASVAELNRLRPGRVAMVFQDPLASLNPYISVGDQLRRILLEHKFCAPADARSKTLEMLGRVGLPDPGRQYRSYPHQLSGGMRQRVMIGAALLGDPDLLIADEPTTALDVTVQAQILTLLRELRQETNAALLLITHDLGVVASHCERTVVMDRGSALEDRTTRELFAAPSSKKMQDLLQVAPCISRECDVPATPSEAPVLLEIDNVTVSFDERRGGASRKLNAVRPFNLSLRSGETIAIVGESGSGKTSLARAVVGLIATKQGAVSYLGRKLAANVKYRSRANHRDLQMVFQDPLASLNPAMRVVDIVQEPLQVHAQEGDRRDQVVSESLQRVGISKAFFERYPHELSGGQAQRVAIARALILKPKVLICDEAVAALDGTVQEEILSLLREEQQRSGLAIIFITHDLAVVRQISHRVVVMYMGRAVEVAPCGQLFRRPRHPYTKALLDAVPKPDPTIRQTGTPLVGEVGSIISPPGGCSFNPRCELAIAICSDTLPQLSVSGEGMVACHRAEELDLTY